MAPLVAWRAWLWGAAGAALWRGAVQPAAVRGDKVPELVGGREGERRAWSCAGTAIDVSCRREGASSGMLWHHSFRGQDIGAIGVAIGVGESERGIGLCWDLLQVGGLGARQAVLGMGHRNT